MKQKIIITICAIVFLLASVVTCIIICNQDSNKPPNEQMEGNQSEIEEENDDDNTLDFIVPESILMTIDERDVIISCNNNNVIFSITQGTSVTLNQNKISAIDYGESHIKATLDTITKDIKVIVLKIDFNLPENLKCGKKANNEYDTYELTINSNYPLSNYTTNNTNLTNIERTLQSQDSKTIKYQFNIIDETAIFKLKVFDIEFTKQISAVPYISNFDYQFSKSLTKNSFDEFILYKISNNNYSAQANQDGFINSLSLNITSTQNYSLTLSNNNLILDENSITTSNIGQCSLKITANDGSNYSESIKFNIQDVMATSIVCDIENINLKILTNKSYSLSYSYLPCYATVHNFKFEFDNDSITLSENIVTAIKPSSSELKIVLNELYTETINVTIADEFSISYINNKNNLPLTSKIINIDFETEQDISIQYIIKDYLGHASVNQTLDIDFDTDIEIETETIDRIYLLFKTRGQVIINISNAELAINDQITVNAN